MKTVSAYIANLLTHSYNADVSTFDASFLNKSIRNRMAATFCNTPADYYTYLKQNNNEEKEFLDSLHISYSEFFRNPLTFSVLEHIILPSLIQKKKNPKQKEIRIWSAACAGGQEAYSLAMLMEEFKNNDKNNLLYRIFATDHSKTQVNGARKGLYSTEAIDNLHLKRVNQWFTKRADTYAVKPELKKNIDFSVFDLLSRQFSSPPASIFGDFDLVICANLLYYYNSETRKIILEKITNCLALGGYLVTGEAERDIFLKHNYLEVFPQSGIFQSKNVMQLKKK